MIGRRQDLGFRRLGVWWEGVVGISRNTNVVVDFHLHVGSQNMAKEFVSAWVEGFIAMGSGLEKVLDKNNNLSADRLEALLEENGVDYGVCLAEYSPITTGITENEYVAQFCKGRNRLIPFGNINPYMVRDLKAELSYLTDELGMAGLKMYPSYQHFYPNEARLYPLYEAAQERGLVIMSHTGSSIFPGARLKYGEPLCWDDVAVDFPGLSILLVHGGRGFWYEQAAFLAQLHPNVFVEISGLPPQNLLNYFPRLEKLADKVIFGSDWPAVPGLRKNINAISQLPISEEAKVNILGLNAAKLLKL